MQIDNFTVLKLNENVIKRFEHNLQGGTMILYNIETQDVWFGNSASRELIKLIDGKTTLEDIYIQFLSNYENKFHQEIIENLNVIVEDLYKQNFIL